MTTTLHKFDPLSGAWQEIGGVTDVQFSHEDDGSNELLGHDPYPFYRARWVSHTIEIPIATVGDRVLELVFGLPLHPVKRRGLTGKAYRQACRAYQRRLKAYRRGEPGWRDVA